MSAINSDISTQLTATNYADAAAAGTMSGTVYPGSGAALNSQTSFGNYLQWAQSQSADGTAQPGGQDDPNASQATAPAATDQPAPSVEDRRSQRAHGRSSSPQTDATKSSSPQADSTPSTAADNDTTATLPHQRNNGEQGSDGGQSNQDTGHSADAGQKDDPHKVEKTDVTATVVDIGTVAQAATSPQTAGGNGTFPGGDPSTMSGTVHSRTRSAAGASQNQAPGARSTAAAVPPANPAAATNVSAPVVAAQTAATQTTPATAQSTQTAAQTAPAASLVMPTPTQAAPAATQATPAVVQTTVTGPTDPADATSPATPADTTNSTDSPPKPRTAADAKSSSASGAQSVGANGTRAASAAQDADTSPLLAAPGTDDTTSLVNAQALREQRANSAVEAFSQSASGNDTNTTATQPAASASGPTVAAVQAATQNATAAGSGSSAAGYPLAGAADTNLSQADRVRFVQRVEQAFQDLNGQGGSVRLRLSPPELGSLNIDIKVVKGMMTARVEAETPAARNILLDNLPALRDRLAQQDIKVQRFDVDLMNPGTRNGSGSGMSNQSSQYQNPSQNAGTTAVRGPFRSDSPPAAAVEAAPSRPVSVAGHLNVVV